MKKGEFRCPGQNTMFWKPGDIYDVTCPNCGASVEFWKDDAKRTCKKCGYRFLNPKRDLGCLEWCKYAEKCMPEMFSGENLGALYRDRLLAMVKRKMRPEDERLQHLLDLLDRAEEILSEEGGEPKVIIAAVIFADLLGSPLKTSSQAEVRKILTELGTETEVIEQVCSILVQGALSPEPEDLSQQIVADALNLLRLEEKRELLEEAALEQLIEQKLHTETGRRLAREELW